MNVICESIDSSSLNNAEKKPQSDEPTKELRNRSIESRFELTASKWLTASSNHPA